MGRNADRHINERAEDFVNGKGQSNQVQPIEGSDTGNMLATKTVPVAIAICGMAMRLPGGIRDATGFWDVLYNGKDMRGPIPADRYNAKGFDGSMGKSGAIETQHGYFLTNDLSCLDTSFFTLTKAELEKTDPQQRQILEVTRECLENAGEIDYRGKLIGCYVGTFGEDWLHSISKESQHHGGYSMSGDLMIANRVSFEFDFKGPSMTIKTGCSASLIGLHEACRALQSRDCDAAIVAGTSLTLGPLTTSLMSSEGILSPEGSCKTFDAAADGFARGEAINAVFVKRLEDALRDNSPIRAIIRATGTNSDGRGPGLLAPNSKSHEALMHKVYADAKLDPRRTAFVECHGTGTPVGDPIEAAAVGNVFGEKGVFIGSVKPNLGHSEGASGISSLIKAVLTLENKTIPPNIKFRNANPKIPFVEKKLKVPLKPMPWPEDCAKRVSINSFGIGGSNAHVVVDSSDSLGIKPVASGSATGRRLPQLMLFSANTQDSLQRVVGDYQTYLRQHPDRISDLSYTLACRREHLPHRAFVVSETDSFKVSTFEKAQNSLPRICMIFTGQGASWPGMAQDFVAKDSHFRADIEAMDGILRSLKSPPSWTILSELSKSAKTSQLHRAEVAQIVCTAIQIALVNALVRSGVQPEAVIGHSSGEIAAAYAAGVLSVAEAIIVAYYRGYVTRSQILLGGMAAVGLSARETSSFLEDGVSIACENSSRSTTISGDLDQLEKVLYAIKAENPDTLARRLRVDMAYHSREYCLPTDIILAYTPGTDHMVPLSKEYVNLIEDEVERKNLVRSNPRVTFFSSVTGDLMTDSDSFGSTYWSSNLTMPVKFYSAVNTFLQQPYKTKSIFLEIGPHSTLAGPLREICGEVGTPCTYIPTMLRSEPCFETFLSAIGQLYQQGAKVRFDDLVPSGRVLTDLPTYPWDHTVSYWAENRVSKDWRFRQYGHHALLGQRVPESTSFDPCWRNMLGLEDEPWLADHKVRENVVFPFAGYVAIAGEAVRQLTGIETGYSVRHVVARTALVLHDFKPVEVVTTLRHEKFTDSNESGWFAILISTYSGSTWIKNCEGSVRANALTISNLTERVGSSQQYPRAISSSKWYESMAHIGLNYGPEFQGMTDISARPSRYSAAAVIQHSQEQLDAPFLFHPAAMDACLQLAIVAMAKGQGRNLTQLCIPTLVEELNVARGALAAKAESWCAKESGEIGIVCHVGDRIAFQLRGIRMNVLDDDLAVTPVDYHGAAQLKRLPDFDFMEMPPLFSIPKSSEENKRLLEEMTLLCILDSADRLEGLIPEQPHYLKFRDWLQREIKRAESGTYPIVENAASYVKLSSPSRLNMIRERFDELSKTPLAGFVATGITRIHKNIDALFLGKMDTLQILMEDNVLTKIYDAVSFGHGNLVRMLSNSKPNLRILEVGAGTGGTIELILRDLSSEGNPSYSVYTFTDISAGFFPQAKERFSYAANMDYKIFDISRNPFEQGFERASYDLILAPNVIHATPSLQETLRNLQPLLRPEGYLVLSEVCAQARAPGYVFGNFSGWWLGEADGRRYEPGFEGASITVYDAEAPYHYCAAIVTRPAKVEVSSSRKQSMTVLCEHPQSGISQRLISELEKKGFEVLMAKLGELVSISQDVISTLDLESHFFENIGEQKFISYQQLLRSLQPQANFLWLMPPTQINCSDPHSAQTIGMIRVNRAELAVPITTLEIEASEKDFTHLVLQVFGKISAHRDTHKFHPDREYAVDNGVIKVGRYYPFALEKKIEETRISGLSHVKTLEIAKPGLLESLRWIEGSMPSSLQGDQVEIDVRAVGLNFRDVVVAMGMYGLEANKNPLGVELSGTVRRIGSGVRHVGIGDRVIGVAADGCFTTHAIILALLVVKIPDDLSFDEAATMAGAFTTVVRSLIDLCQLEKNQSVLIHSACGGVGHAAIQICRMIEAEIFVTAGSDEKRLYLLEKMGIPKDHIFKSRDIAFLEAVKSATNGRGVDIVLNSLSGELLHASWQCVAEFGTMIELSKRDLAGFGKLDMENFLANRSYSCVDIGHMIEKRPEQVGRILNMWMDMYRQSHIQPIRPMAVFEARDVEQSFRYLQKGNHIGKAIVRFSDDISTIPSVPRGQALTFDANASYLLTGGLGGLGKSIATWMVERGARHLIFLSRSAGTNEQDRAFEVELADLECTVSFVAGKAQEKDDVAKAISQAREPIKGVLHLAMVLRDNPILDMTHSEWTAAVSPKVDGAWVLHNAFLEHDLDFFLMTSSLVTLVDEPGQSNYCAANTFLESFCQYRHNLGLPASVLSICPIEGVGFVAENPAVQKKLKSQEIASLSESSFLKYMELSILSSQPPKIKGSIVDPLTPWVSHGHLIMGLKSEVNLNDPHCQTSWRHDRRMSSYHNVQDMSSVSDSALANQNNLKAFLARAAHNPEILDLKSSSDFLAQEIGAKVYKFMLKPEEENIDIGISLTQLGLDSLMAIELRRWWKQAFGIAVSVLEIMGSGTLEGLGELAASGVKGKILGEEGKDSSEKVYGSR